MGQSNIEIHDKTALKLVPCIRLFIWVLLIHNATLEDNIYKYIRVQCNFSYFLVQMPVHLCLKQRATSCKSFPVNSETIQSTPSTFYTLALN